MPLAGNPLRNSAQNLPPGCSERLQPDSAARTRTPPRGKLRTAFPARRTVAQTRHIRPGESLRQHRADPILGRPVVHHPRCGHAKDTRRKTINPDTRKQKQTVIVHHPANIRQTRVRRPANGAIARTKLHPRRRETNAAKNPVTLGTHPVPELTTRRTPPTLRMMRRNHRLPTAAVLRIRYKIQRHRPKIPERGSHPCVGKIQRRRDMRIKVNGLRLRQAQAQLIRKLGQKNPRRRQNRLPRRAIPALLLT